MKTTLAFLIIALSLGSGAIHFAANAQASDDCVDWKEAIKSVNAFAGFYTIMELAGVPDSPNYVEPLEDGILGSLFFPTDTDGFTMLAPTNEAIWDYFKQTPPFDCDDGTSLLTFTGGILGYHVLTDKAYGDEFGLGGNRYQLMKTAFNELPLRIQKSGGGGREANSPQAIGTITEPDLPDNICVPVVAENGEVVNVPMTIYAIDQIMLPFAITPSCGSSFSDCAEEAYSNGIADINRPKYIYGKKVKWAK